MNRLTAVRRRPSPDRTGRPRTTWTRRLVVGVVGLVVAAGCAPKNSIGSVPTHSITGSEVALRAGMSAGPELLWESDAEQNADLAGIQNSGVHWITIDIDWNSIQGDGPSSFRWDRATDRVVTNARAHGLTILGMAAYSPPWARIAGCPPGEVHCLPANADDYGRFLTAAAARYGSRSTNPLLRNTITTWQLWNEPNHQEFAQPKPNPDVYTAMLKSAYAGIKAVDPSATVITGGTAPAPDAADGTDYSPVTWLRDLYARGAGGSFDAIAHHPYAFPVNPLEPHPWNAYTQTLVLHDVMASNGDGAKRIWGTEMGAPTGTAPDVLSESQQAQWVHDYYLGWNTTFRSFTGPLIWMELRDSGANVGDKWQNLGLLHRDRQPKPAYAAFQTVMSNGV